MDIDADRIGPTSSAPLETGNRFPILNGKRLVRCTLPYTKRYGLFLSHEPRPEKFVSLAAFDLARFMLKPAYSAVRIGA